ncbi:MAG: hypothetical protein ACR2LY_09855 [Thermoleophilaceae bacterium]
MTREDDEVLGNLPRSRPGRRSSLRSDESPDPEGPGGARTPPEEHGPPLATDADVEATAGGDPLSGAVRAAANVARTGVRAAGRITGGVLRRLPRR